MKTPWRTVAALAGLLLAGTAVAADGDATERERIAAARRAVQQRYEAAERACNERFAVTDCVEVAQRDRRESMLRLRREETLLDEAQRRQRAAERVEAIRRKVGAEAQARVPAPREARAAAAPRAPKAGRAAGEAADAPSALRRGRVTVRERSAHAGSATDRAAQESRSKAAYEARQNAAKDHLEENRRRNAEHAKGKPPAAPLPAASGASR